jgi:hypothetical protein
MMRIAHQHKGLAFWPLAAVNLITNREPPFGRHGSGRDKLRAKSQ